MRKLFDRFIEIVFSSFGGEVLGLVIVGGSILLAAYCIMQRLGIAPASEADRNTWFVGVFAAIVFGIFGLLVAMAFWPRGGQ